MAEGTLAELLADRLGDAHAAAQNGDVDSAVTYARLALEDWERAGCPEGGDSRDARA